MTDEEAETLRLKLCAHYNDQVLPVGEVCKILEQWGNVANDFICSMMFSPATNPARKPNDDSPMLDVQGILNAAAKSSLLGRLLYGREKLRTQKCSVHKGRWSGIYWPEPECGCQGTGWLREKDDVEKEGSHGESTEEYVGTTAGIHGSSKERT